MKLKIIYNYFFLAILAAMVGMSFLPKEMLIQAETISWKFLFIPTSGIVLVSIFLCLNRQTVTSILSESFVGQKHASNHFGFLIKECIFKREVVFMLFITLVAFTVFSHRLDALDFWDDEYLVLKAAEGYHQTGTYNQWDFIKKEITQVEYTRAWPHTWLIAHSYGFFGVSEWSSRIVSVGLGCLFIFSAFFVVFYFTGNAFFSTLVAVVFMLNPDFIYFFRHTRMYALLIPLFFIWSMFVFQAVEGRSQWLEADTGKRAFVTDYLNFDYRFVTLSLLLLYWGYHIHVNSLLMVLTTLAYVFIIAAVDREKKHICLAVFMITFAIAEFLLMPKTGILKYTLHFVSFFKSIKPLFLKLMVSKPFFNMANLMLLCGSTLFIFFSPNKLQRKKLLFFLLMVLVGLFFFIFVADFHSQHYRYICHVTPFAIMMICLSYFIILKIFQNKLILTIGLTLLLLSQAYNFIQGIEYLYYGARGQPYPSIAYATVKENLNPGEVIFAQFLHDFYMQGIPKETRIINLGRVIQGSTDPNPYNFERFFEDIKRYRKGWIIWDKYKEYHVSPQVAAYVKTLFRKIHGEGIDETGIEIYYFDESMIKLPVFK